MTDSVPKDVAAGSKYGAYQIIAHSDAHFEAVVSDQVYLEDSNVQDILYGMHTPLVYNTVSHIDSSPKDAKSNRTHLKYNDPNETNSFDKVLGWAVSSYAGLENAESRYINFDDGQCNSNNFYGNEFSGAEEPHDNSQEIQSITSAKVSDDDQRNQGALNDRFMLKRWLKEPTKDGPYVASQCGNTSRDSSQTEFRKKGKKRE